MLRYAKAIADIIHKGFHWVYSSFIANEADWNILKSTRYLFIVNILRTWISKAE